MSALAEGGFLRLRASRVSAVGGDSGKRRLRTAEQDGNLPAYVFGGPEVLPKGTVRRAVMQGQLIPSGLGRAMTRMGNALDHDSNSGHADTGCGGGGGGGGD